MCLIFGCDCNDKTKVDYYEKLIKEGLKAAEEFELPKDARMYKVENETLEG